MSIVKLYNKERDVTYVYESFSYWDKEKKQPRNKRKLIGKIDPASGEIVPTNPRKKKRDRSDSDYQQLYETALADIAQKEQRISELENQLKEYTEGEVAFFRAIETAMDDRRKALHRQSSHD